MATTKEIKRRRASIESTGKVTASMKLVATVKLQQSKQVAERAVPYFSTLCESMASIFAKSQNVLYKYSKKSDTGKDAMIVISSNKGLAGGFNANLYREIANSDYHFDKNNLEIYTIGRKLKELLIARGYSIKEDYSDYAEKVDMSVIQKLVDKLLLDFVDGKIRSIYICYTAFKNTMVQKPVVMKAFPITTEDLLKANTESNKNQGFEIYKSEYATDDKMIMSYEPSDEEVLNMLTPKYITSLVYFAQTTSIASENGARMTAMDNATKNANDLIDKLTIQFNRARQGAITQELTEIIAGANAI